ncbi:MAG: hypothetical protein IJ583_09455 [Firmicutes bacterium]|nr:hypothetical protein [Bacillota bacterium]
MRKSLLKTVVTTIIIGATLTLMSISVLADNKNYDQYFSYAVTDANKTATWTQTGGDGESLSSGDNFKGILFSNGKVVLHKNKYIKIGNSTDQGSIDIPVPVGSAGKINLVGTTAKAGRIYKLDSSEATVAKSVEIEFNATDTNDGKLNLTVYNDGTNTSDNKVESTINKITIKITNDKIFDPVIYKDSENNDFVVVENEKYYAIGKIAIADTSSKESVVFTVGNKSYDSQTVVYKKIIDSNGNIIAPEEDGVYYVAVTVANVPDDTAAKSMTELISLE